MRKVVKGSKVLRLLPGRPKASREGRGFRQRGGNSRPYERWVVETRVGAYTVPIPSNLTRRAKKAIARVYGLLRLREALGEEKASREEVRVLGPLREGR